MSQTLRGADIVARSLKRLGCRRVFTLSGNHIMSIFDAALDAELDLVHVRHEAAAVHMADAHGRLTGEPGIALVTGGPGHANAVGALFTALGAELPMVLLSGHAATWELGRGGFQELRQADMAAPVTKASWTSTATDDARPRHRRGHPHRHVGPARAGASEPAVGPARCARSRRAPWSGREPACARPAPRSPTRPRTRSSPRSPTPRGRSSSPARRCRMSQGRALLAKLEAATGAPAVIMESPRGIADATLGAFPDLVKRADLIVLLGKALDFTTKWAAGPAFDPDVRVIAIDPDEALVERARKEKGERLLIGTVADSTAAAEALIARAGKKASAIPAGSPRPAPRSTTGRRHGAASSRKTPGRLHPAEVFRALRPFVERDPDTVLICDGGEFAQWGQSMLPVRRRLINGVTGSIGSALSFALAARLVEPKAPVFAVLGDGTIGFHIAEFETAVRRGLPFVAVLGNDARWNAESEIQRRDYGANRMHGCELLPARYDQVVAALGGHGEHVDAGRRPCAARSSARSQAASPPAST